MTRRAWESGVRVRNRPEFASLWNDSHWGAKLALPRGGVVIEAPLVARTAGEGTLLIEWDSLTGPKQDPEVWRMWIHSSMVEAV